MGQFNLNLSTRPFRAYRAANLGLFVVLLVLIAVSVWQVFTYKENSSLAASIRGNQQKAKQESERLTKDLGILNAKLYSGNAASKIAQVAFLNEILRQKTFSWTKVFASLEEVTPENVYLLSLRPFSDEQGNTGLNITIRAKSFQDALGFVRTLEDSNIFGKIAVAEEAKKDAQPMGEVEMALSTYYFPVNGPVNKGAE